MPYRFQIDQDRSRLIVDGPDASLVLHRFVAVFPPKTECKIFAFKKEKKRKREKEKKNKKQENKNMTWPIIKAAGKEVANKTTTMEEVMPELVEMVTVLVLSHVDRISLVACRFVCTAWMRTTTTRPRGTHHAEADRHEEGKRFVESAAEGGHLAGLQWARAHGCPWDENTCAWAAEEGHLEVLKWVLANGCLWEDRVACAHAARGGHLEVLQWARANGCPWDESTCERAARGGHLEVLQWARANGCPS
jgi:hypothetical protein